MAEATNDYERVLRALIQFKSMPFLEITALCDINEGRLHEIVAEMERRKMVRVANRHSILDQVVTLRESAFAA